MRVSVDRETHKKDEGGGNKPHRKSKLDSQRRCTFRQPLQRGLLVFPRMVFFQLPLEAHNKKPRDNAKEETGGHVADVHSVWCLVPGIMD